MLPERLANINLLPEFEKQSRAGSIIIIGLLIIILFGSLFVGYEYFSTNKNLDSAKSKQSSLQTEVDALNAQLFALQNENTTDSLEDSVLFVDNYNFPTSKYIRDLVSLLPENGYLTSYNYSTLDAGITTGFETLDKIANYTTALTISDYNFDAKLNNVSTAVFDGVEEADEYDFNILSRYEANFSLQIDKDALKGEAEVDE